VDSVSGWESSYFDFEFSDLTQSYVGKTKDVSINEPLDQKVFELEFPVGTQVSEEKDGKKRYYVQEVGSRRRQIPQEEYGRLPSDKLPSQIR
jgi:hypothetical protein